MKQKLLLLLSALSLVASAAPVKVSTFGFDAKDATDCLQKAIDSGAEELVVDYTGKEWLIRPIKLRSNQTVYFADKVVVRAMPDAYKGVRDYMFTAENKENIKLIGQGKVVLRMNKADYQDAKRYKVSEWRHLLNFQSCDNITIKNLDLRSSGGDGIYIGRNFAEKTGRGCRNVVIENVLAIDHHRQGLSIISVENFLVRNSKFNATRGIPPQTGVDFEPNFQNELLGNCVMENCEFNDNFNNGLDLYLVNLDEKSAPVSFLFKNCLFRNNRAFGAKMTFINPTRSATLAVRGSIRFVDCTFADNRQGAISVASSQAGGAMVEFTDCKVIQRGKSAPFEFSNDGMSDLANIRFTNVSVQDFSTAPDPVRYVSFSGYGIGRLDGVLQIERNGKKSSFAMKSLAAKYLTDKVALASKPAVFDAVKPVPVSEKVPAVVPSLDYRHNTTFIQYAKAGQTVRLDFIIKQYNAAKPAVKVQVQMVAPSGKKLDKFTITKYEHAFTFKAAETGTYRFEVHAPIQTFRVKTDAPGFGFDASNAVHMFRSNGSLYFPVPAGIASGVAIVTGVYGEPVDAELLDVTGKAVDGAKRIEGFKALKFTRADASKPTVMQIRFSRAVEDYNVRLAAPLPAILSESPEALLR